MYPQAATCSRSQESKEVTAMTVHEQAEAMKKKLAEMGITTDAELRKAIEETRIDIAMFVNKPEGEKSA